MYPLRFQATPNTGKHRKYSIYNLKWNQINGLIADLISCSFYIIISFINYDIFSRFSCFHQMDSSPPPAWSYGHIWTISWRVLISVGFPLPYFVNIYVCSITIFLFFIYNS